MTLWGWLTRPPDGGSWVVAVCDLIVVGLYHLREIFRR